MMLFERIEELRRKAEVPSHELRIVFRSVDAGEIKDKVCLRAINVEVFRGVLSIVLENRVDLQGTGSVFAVTDGFQRFDQISSNET